MKGWAVGGKLGAGECGQHWSVTDGKKAGIVRPGSFLQICSMDAEQEERDPQEVRATGPQ